MATIRVGSVSIRKNHESVLLVIQFCGKRLNFSPHLRWDDDGLKLAQVKAGIINADLFCDRFDPTFSKYKGKSAQGSLSLSELFERYIETKKSRSPSSQKWYRQVLSYLDKCPYKWLWQDFQIFDWIQMELPPDTGRRVLRALESCCQWALERKILTENPFFHRSKTIRVPKSNHIDPFTPKELQAILSAFSESEYFAVYLPLVKFLFLTGCRPGEAMALTWRQVSSDFSRIIFDQALALGKVKKGLKTQLRRTFPCGNDLRELLVSIKPEGVKGDDFVFPSPLKNGPICPDNFNDRAWRSCLKAAEVRFRTLYQTRHTFVSNCVQRGVNIARVAQWVGSSVEVLSRRYCGVLGDELPPDL